MFLKGFGSAFGYYYTIDSYPIQNGVGGEWLLAIFAIYGE